MLKADGYPFKSKEHSNKLSIYQHSGYETKTITRYLDSDNSYGCPNILKYQFTPAFNIKISDRCCHRMKKEPAQKWSIENNKSIVLTGMRAQEGGQRANKGCAVFNEDGTLKKFHPLHPINSDFIERFINDFNIQLCELYYPPFNFERTGCKGCPFALDLENQLETMSYFLPDERKQCEYIWEPIYKEYRRINYRLNDSQPLLFN